MASISSLGVGSGLEAESIVTQLVALEKQPGKVITTQNSKLETAVSTWGKVQSAFSSLQDATKALNSNDFWSATKGVSSDSTAVGVTTGSASTAGSYNITVQSLASAQSIASTAYADKTAVVGEGTLKIELGSYTGSPPAATFNAKAAATSIDIPIGPGDNTLEKIRDRINSANAGITASLVNDVSGARLVLRGATGQENGFKVSVTESPSAPGLAALAYDGTKAAAESPMTRTQSATNALATINGLQVGSSTNTLDSVIDGLTLNLSKVTEQPVTVTVNQDQDSIRKGIDTFVSAYNNVVSTIRVQSMYDEASKTGGPLQGDATARGMLTQLRAMISGNSSASSAFSRLPDMGLDIAKDGTLSVKSAKLNDALGNLNELKKFFSATDEADVSKTGMGQRITSLTKQILDAEGAIATRTDGLKGTIARNKDKIERIDKRAELVESRLRAQYTALDASMAKLNGLSSYMAAQLSLLNKN